MALDRHSLEYLRAQQAADQDWADLAETLEAMIPEERNDLYLRVLNPQADIRELTLRCKPYDLVLIRRMAGMAFGEAMRRLIAKKKGIIDTF